jgi:Zn-finger nucleic acid-binding protein
VTTLTCPKCQGAMRSYERGGVTVDQCADCRGIFLDRGELEHLLDAERGWSQRPPPEHAPPAGRRDEAQHKRRKRSFLDELFD